jgi:hypothetical protein
MKNLVIRLKTLSTIHFPPLIELLFEKSRLNIVSPLKLILIDVIFLGLLDYFLFWSFVIFMVSLNVFGDRC